MMNTHRTAPLLLLCLTVFPIVLAGCEGGAEQADNQQQYDDAQPAQYNGPPFDFDVTTDGDITHFQWSVRVPTGGWELKQDSIEYDESTGHIELYLQLTPPDPDQMVTQALVTHNGQYTVEEAFVDSAVLAVMYADNTSPQGEPVEYAKAAQWQR